MSQILDSNYIHQVGVTTADRMCDDSTNTERIWRLEGQVVDDRWGL